jgi:hypothetical protein
VVREHRGTEGSQPPGRQVPTCDALAVPGVQRGRAQRHGEGRACNKSYGSFTIKTIEFDRTGMKKLDMTFEQHCEAKTAPAMRGSVRMGLKG